MGLTLQDAPSPQLTAGGINIASQLSPHRGSDAAALQTLLKLPHPAAGLQWRFRHFVERDQIYVARLAPQKLGQSIRLFIRIIHCLNHGIFIGDAPPGGLKIPPAGIHEQIHPYGPVHRHKLRAGLVIWGMERNTQS
jgi:hypothetical protein